MADQSSRWIDSDYFFYLDKVLWYLLIVFFLILNITDEILKVNDDVVKVMTQYKKIVEGKTEENGLDTLYDPKPKAEIVGPSELVQTFHFATLWI